MPIPLPGGVKPKAPAGVSGDAIAADALRYRGHPYSFGGWDCSSFVNHVLGNDLGMALPGGVRGYHGPPPHGPVVLDYAGWGGAQAVSAPSRGDLVLWPGAGAGGHMGIVLGPNQMISALDPAMGTAVTPIQGYGPAGITPVYRRVRGAAAGAPAPGGPAAQGPGAGSSPAASLAGPLAALLVVGGMVAVILAGAVLAGAGAVLAGSWIAGRMVGDG